MNRVTSQEVKNFHNRDDVDASKDAHHHTLGFGHTQAAPGDTVMRLIERIKSLEARVTALEEPEA